MKIAVLPGDGIGPEVTAQAVKVLKAVVGDAVAMELTEAPVGGAGVDAAGDPLPDVARRSLAVEPMTCPPNAFRSGESLVRLEPGESFTSSWGLMPSILPR